MAIPRRRQSGRWVCLWERREQPCLCFVHDTGVVGGRSQRNGVLFAFLQQHEVQSALISCWREMLTNWRSWPGALVIRPAYFPAWRSRSALVIINPFCTRDGGLHVAAHGTDAGVQVHHHGLLSDERCGEAFALQQHFVVAVDEFGQAGVCQTHVDRQYLVGMVGVIGILWQELRQTGWVLFSARFFSYSGSRWVPVERHSSGRSVRHLAWRFPALFRWFPALRWWFWYARRWIPAVLLCHFVLIVVGITVIDFYQLVDEVHAALGTGIL